MPPLEPFLIFTRKLNELGMPYMVSGSVAAIFYGEPRMTNDVDIIVVIGKDRVADLAVAFPDEEFYRPPDDVIRIEAARSQRGHFNLIHHETGFKADIYPRCDALHDWGLSRSRMFHVDADPVIVAPPEYVAIRKLQFFREGGSEKHLRDIQRMVVTTGETWDMTALEDMVAKHGLEEEWRQVSKYG